MPRDRHLRVNIVSRLCWQHACTLAWRDVRDVPRSCIMHPSHHRTRPTPRVHTSHACPLPCTKIGCLELIFDRALLWLPASSKVVPKTGKRAATSHAMQVSSPFGVATAPFCGLQSGTPCCALDADTAGRSYWPPKSRATQASGSNVFGRKPIMWIRLAGLLVVAIFGSALLHSA
jgi:hypothetical protein